MINNKFIFFNTLEAFEQNRGEISPESIVFIKNPAMIYTHGTFFDGSNNLDDIYIRWYDKNNPNDIPGTEEMDDTVKVTFQTLPQTDYDNLAASNLLNPNTYYFTYET